MPQETELSRSGAQSRRPQRLNLGGLGNVQEVQTCVPSMNSAELLEEDSFEDCFAEDAMLSSPRDVGDAGSINTLTASRHAYDEGRPLLAHRLLQPCMRQEDTSFEAMRELAASISFPLPTFVGDVQNISDVLMEMEDDTGWMVTRDDDLRVLYRHVRGSTVHSVKFQAVLEAPLPHLLALAFEVDMYSLWNRFVAVSLNCTRRSRWEKVCYAAGWAPYPFPQFDTVFQGRVFDLLQEDGSVLILMQTLTAEEEAELPAGCVPPEAAKRKRGTILPGSALRLEPLPLGPDNVQRVKGTIVAHMDPHLSFVPGFLISWLLKVVSPYAYRTIQRIIKDWFLSSSPTLTPRTVRKANPHAGVYERRIESEPELYSVIERRLRSHMAHHPRQG